ncbi:hypothetical protein SCANM63S_05538 [Streptomyces canarius]
MPHSSTASYWASREARLLGRLDPRRPGPRERRRARCRGPGGRRHPCLRRTATQHALVGGPQLRPGVDPEFVRQPGPDGLVQRDRFRLLAVRGQREQQRRLERFVERAAVGGLPHGQQDGAGPAAAQGRGGRLAHDRSVFVFHHGEGRVHRGDSAQVLRAMALPQVQRLQIHVDGRREVARGGRGAGLPDEVAEPEQVQTVRVDTQQVAPRLPDEPPARRPDRQARFEQPAQRADVPVDRVHRADRRVTVPQQADEFRQRDGPSRARQQRREEQALLARAEREFLLGPPGPHRAQQRETYRWYRPLFFADASTRCHGHRGVLLSPSGRRKGRCGPAGRSSVG